MIYNYVVNPFANMICALGMFFVFISHFISKTIIDVILEAISVVLFSIGLNNVGANGAIPIVVSIFLIKILYLYVPFRTKKIQILLSISFVMLLGVTLSIICAYKFSNNKWYQYVPIIILVVHYLFTISPLIVKLKLDEELEVVKSYCMSLMISSVLWLFFYCCIKVVAPCIYYFYVAFIVVYSEFGYWLEDGEQPTIGALLRSILDRPSYN